MTETKFYIAYGSNLNTFEMSLRCPGATVWGTSLIADYRLLFRGSREVSFLTIEPCENARVPVAVWKVTDEHERRLDLYEGFPDYYDKKNMRLPVTRLDNGETETVTGFVYFMHAEKPCGIPTEEYLDTCLEGYDTFRFNPDILEEAVRFSAQKASE